MTRTSTTREGKAEEGKVEARARARRVWVPPWADIPRILQGRRGKGGREPARAGSESGLGSTTPSGNSFRSSYAYALAGRLRVRGRIRRAWRPGFENANTNPNANLNATATFFDVDTTTYYYPRPSPLGLLDALTFRPEKRAAKTVLGLRLRVENALMLKLRPSPMRRRGLFLGLGFGLDALKPKRLILLRVLKYRSDASSRLLVHLYVYAWVKLALRSGLGSEPEFTVPFEEDPGLSSYTKSRPEERTGTARENAAQKFKDSWEIREKTQMRNIITVRVYPYARVSSNCVGDFHEEPT
ncbi:hypothetical protein B0H13DRAFT_2470184 [Mycena leptocephala]|nr:hypothetical protein B0H13DRAFT_2470184 [Mycena leptocephala]